MNKILRAIIFCAFLPIQLFAAKISGIVTDASNGTPLPGVLVVIKELNRPAETDENGRYEFNNIPGGTYDVLYNLITYKKLVQTVSIINNKNVSADVKLKPEANTLKDVTVKGARTTNTENAVLMEIRKSNLIVSGVSAAQIGKTMDRSAADVVKRIPGVTIIDDRFIMVRGLIDRYNSVWLNDAGAPSSETDKKSFSFDLVPSSFIDRVMVYKTPSPDLPGDFAGGMVKIYTASLPDKNEISVGFQTSYREKSTGKTFYFNQPSATDWLGYDDGRRALPSMIPDYINKNDSGNTELTKAFAKNDWIIKNKKTSPDYRFSLKLANVLNLKKVKIGNTLAVAYSNVNVDTIIHRESRDSTTLEFKYNDYRSVNSVNANLMDNLVVAFGNSKIEFKNIYNQTGKSSVTLREAEADSTVTFPDERSYSINYDSKAVYCSQLAGTHKTRSGNTNYNWTLGYTDLFKNQPDLRRIRYSKQPTDDDSLYTAAIANTVDPVNGGGRYFSQLYEHVYSFNHQFTQKLRIRDFDFEVSAGNYAEYKSRFFYSRVLGYTIRPGSLAQQLNRMPLEEIFADSNLGGKQRYRIDEITSKSDLYSAKNTLIASFVSLKLPVTEKLNVFGGVRYEYNTLELKGYVNLDSIEPKVTTKFWLPSVNISYNFTEKTLVRVAYGKTLNRPEFREFSPLYFYDFDSKAGVYGALFPTLLTDTLKVAQIQNADVRFEWYPSVGEMVQAGVFYKSFKDPIQMIILSPGFDSRSLTFINTKEAYCAGLEFDIRKNLSFADGWLGTKVFRDFQFVGNAAFVKSEMTIGDTITQQLDKVPLQGQSPYMYNVGLFYQNDSTGFQATVLYNVFGPRLVAIGTHDIENIGELPFHSMDFNISKTFFKHYTVTAGVQNILNGKMRTVQDINKDNKFTKPGDNDKIFTEKQIGRYFSFGVKIRF